VPADTDEVRFHFPILKFRETDDGDIIVYGKCTDGTPDSDHQIVNPAWSGRALEEWLDKGGNIRVQHSPFLYPAGKGLSLEIDRDGDGAHWLKARVVEDTAKKLVKKGVLQDFSIGVLDPKLSYKNFRAPEGEIMGGRIGEVSLVDRGSNHNSKFTIVKAARNGPAELVARMSYAATPADVARSLAKGFPKPVYPKYTPMRNRLDPALRRAEYSKLIVPLTAKKRKKLVDSGGRDVSDVPDEDFAGPDHTYPLKTQDDVSDAASLAHHADNPAQVRSRIRSIANRKWPGMTMPPSLESKADDGEDCDLCDGTGKIRDGHMKCPDCNGTGKKTINKGGDAADDYAGDTTDDTSEADYNADADADDDDDKDGGDDDSTDKCDDGMKRARKAEKKRKKIGRNDPSAAAGGAKGKQSRPAPLPTGQLDADPAGSDWSTKSIPVQMRKLHAAVCPTKRAGKARKSLGLSGIHDALPIRELQEMTAAAISNGDTGVADYMLTLIKSAEELLDLPEGLLAQVRKSGPPWPDLIPNTHPAQTNNVNPGMFQGGYQSAGHPSLSAQAAGSPRPNAAVRHVDAADFTRSYMTAGHPPASPGEERQATFDSAVLGSAANAMARLHSYAKSTYPELCNLNVEQRNYASGDGSTGISAAHPLSGEPTSPGEAGLMATNYNKSQRALTKAAKQQRKLRKIVKAQEAEIARLGAEPDPEKAAFRGLIDQPAFGGPVDRTSFIDKATAGGPADDGERGEYVEFLKMLESSGDPTVRQNATAAIKSLLVAP